mgnify:CR=1 FL=1|tara:strand:+ start:347 stop:520 length:174 start_codon:yes stop_codon:yes gene_type:complete
MKKFLFILIFSLCACSKNIVNNDLDNKFGFSKKLTMNEFIKKLEIYSKESSYPSLED